MAVKAGTSGAPSGATRPVPSRTLLTRDDRRASILRAAATAFARNGFAGTSMSAVATEAKVTRVLLYRHFDSKEALYRAVLDQILELLRVGWVGLVADHAVGEVVQTHLSAARANPSGYRLLWHHADTEPAFADYAHEVRVLFMDIADERVGIAIRPELRAWAMATLISSIVEAVLAWLDHGDQANDDLFVSTASAGLRTLVVTWSRPS